MSDTIKFTLDENEYNSVFMVASSISGEKSKIASSKIVEIIRDEVQKGATKDDDGKDIIPKTITIDLSKRLLDGFFIGITEKTKDDKITTNDVVQLKSICTKLKMKNRFENFVNQELESIPENTEAFDDEVVEVPFDEE